MLSVFLLLLSCGDVISVSNAEKARKGFEWVLMTLGAFFVCSFALQQNHGFFVYAWSLIELATCWLRAFTWSKDLLEIQWRNRGKTGGELYKVTSRYTAKFLAGQYALLLLLLLLLKWRLNNSGSRLYTIVSIMKNDILRVGVHAKPIHY